MSAALSDIAKLDHAPEIMIAVSIVFLALTWSAVLLRVFVRGHLIHSLGWDDWTMLATFLLFTGQCSCLIAVGHIEMGQRLRNAASDDEVQEVDIVSTIIKLILSLLAFYLWVTVVLKISLAIFFLRVITVQWHRKMVYTATSIYTIFAVGFAFVAIFQCGDLNNFIVTWVADGCMSDDILQPLNYLSAVLNAMVDWIFVFFPLHVILKSTMARNSKISACILLLVGSMGSVASLIRIRYIPGLRTTPDFFSKSIDIAVWSVVEPGIGIFVVSLATLRPLFRCALATSRGVARSLGCSDGFSSKGSGWSSDGLDFQDRGLQPCCCERGLKSNLDLEVTSPRCGKGLSDLKELGYDMNEVSYPREASHYWTHDTLAMPVPTQPASYDITGHIRAPSPAFLTGWQRRHGTAVEV